MPASGCRVLSSGMLTATVASAGGWDTVLLTGSYVRKVRPKALMISSGRACPHWRHFADLRPFILFFWPHLHAMVVVAGCGAIAVVVRGRLSLESVGRASDTAAPPQYSKTATSSYLIQDFEVHLLRPSTETTSPIQKKTPAASARRFQKLSFVI